MRKATLLKSVRRLLGSGEEVHDAAFMWQRHRLMAPFAAVAFVALAFVATGVGWDEWPTRLAIGAAGAAVAVAATTEYRIVAATSTGLKLFRSSRIRQYAVEMIETLPGDADVIPVGGTWLVADWQVGDRVYTVPKSSEQAINRIASGRPSGR